MMLRAASGATAAYGPYGVGPDPGTTRFGYTGQMALEGTGLYYFRARVYAPSLGRFLEPDPIRFAGGFNLYAYTGGDPINFTDPTGLIGGVSCPGTRIRAPTFEDCPTPIFATGPIQGGGGGTSGGGGGSSGAPPPCDSSNMCEEIKVIGTPLPPLTFFSISDLASTFLPVAITIGNNIAQVVLNAIQGKIAEEEIAQELKAKGCRVVRQVTLEDPDTGLRSRVDIVAHPALEPSPVERVFIEVKSGLNSRFSPNQLAVLGAIARGTAIPRGRKAELAGLIRDVPLAEQDIKTVSRGLCVP